MKWYAGGQERKKVEMKLLIELYQSTEDPILKEFFAKYIRELDWGTSIPFALSAMNIEMASVLLKNKILLTKEQEEKGEVSFYKRLLPPADRCCKWDNYKNQPFFEDKEKYRAQPEIQLFLTDH